MERFDKHKLFALVNRGLLKKTQAKKRFLDCFQVWSDHFQKMVLTRAATLHNDAFEELTMSHLEEELGHNRDIKNNRIDFEPVFDPVLEAASSWFAYKMTTATELEKLLISGITKDIIEYKSGAALFKERLCICTADIITDSIVYPI
ncbi:hypothetical protein [Photorhabdus luminescens]|uniref:hypothetical protein n=1 Tax=Photorhabdus luminescens TaxID=29488 RepID=UPI00159EC258|nr:hypothetical protein [Photorhabdus luminescens]